MDSFSSDLDNALYGRGLWKQFVAQADRFGLSTTELSKISDPSDPNAVDVLPLEYWHKVLDVWRKWLSRRSNS